MPQTINTNLVSLNTQRNLNSSQGALGTAMQRLSSGLRVNSAKDDAAGLAIAERMNTQVRGMNVAIRNANDGISLAQTAEGALGKVGDALQRMRELAVQSANATNSDTDRDNLDDEYKALAGEVDRILQGSKFNGVGLFDGTAPTSLVFQVGANNDANDQITVDMTASSALAASADITALVTGANNSITGVGAAGQTAAQGAIGAIDTAIDTITKARSNFGAVQNRFDSAIANLQVASENQAASRSRIMDADFAAETAALSRAQILQQAGNAMLAQANQMPQQVMKLLG